MLVVANAKTFPPSLWTPSHLLAALVPLEVKVQQEVPLLHKVVLMVPALSPLSPVVLLRKTDPVVANPTLSGYVSLQNKTNYQQRTMIRSYYVLFPFLHIYTDLALIPTVTVRAYQTR
ncbi:hypothetical protein Taro_048257 [Colocasia esculenta]|uniref:Uncharacterized protein n=1 Tax=Colocasia esculenta TaxID=4460 RepID=A0A843X7R8_COLES|nr:hypothetical protein [Colocasia esculenta]